MSENFVLNNAYQQLRIERLTTATRPYNARGKLLKRCERCQLGLQYCICHYHTQSQLNFDFVLLMHKDEILKPTNTGRLIADLFPAQTYAFCWHRTEPPAELIQLLADEQRQCYLLFPAEPSEQRLVFDSCQQILPLPENKAKRITIILLDGTWKQARRMMQLSRYLDSVPAVGFLTQQKGEYAVRKAKQDHHVCTAEAAALVIGEMGDLANQALLSHYFTVFNQHYAASRNAQTPVLGDAHQALLTHQHIQK